MAQKLIRSGNMNRLPLSRRKKILFILITASIPILFFVGLEIFLRLISYGGNLNLFEFPERFGGKYGQLNHQYHENFFFRTATFQAGRGDVFLAEKPENGFRLFVQGASTAESYPYGYNGLFSLVVLDMLRDVLPDRYVEVINIGITATNTYSIYDQARQVVEQKPDAILIYSGQNEYYGALGVASSENIGSYPGFVRLYTKLYRYRTFLMLRDAMGRASNRLTGFDKTEAAGTLMQRMVRQHAIVLGSDIYEAGKYQFSSNLDAILEIYSRHNVPVFIASLASNVKDQPPFYSPEIDELPGGDEIFKMAKEQYHDGRYEEAFQTFRYARDLDGLRFRAPSAFNDIIRQKTERDGVWYVPVKEAMLAKAENGIIGNDLMLEHLHPNSEGYFLMGKTFFQQVIDARLLGVEPDFARLKEEDEYRRAMYLTEMDHRIVWHRVQGLTHSWPFVEEPDPEGYPANYTPVNMADRFAFDYVYERIRWEQAKTGMAQWYVENGRVDEGIEEIMGAIRVVPYEEEVYQVAARLASDGKQPQRAVSFLMEAYSISPSNYTCRTIGLLKVDLEEYQAAAVFFEEAFRLDRSDHHSLFNASVAHASYGNYEKALETAEDLARRNPGFQDLQMWRAHLRDTMDNGGSGSRQ